MTTFIIATRNQHKIQEIRTILGGGFACVGLEAFPGAPPIKEDADTFAGNAMKKSVGLAEWLAANPEKLSAAKVGGSVFVLADDSGLEVDALGGRPGVHSARFAALDGGGEDNSADADNNAKLLRLLKEIPAERRQARFRCVLALTPLMAGADSGTLARETRVFEGSCEGRIEFGPRGKGGFGYDPLFIPDGFAESFAEVGEEVKNRLSHRSKALARLKDAMAGGDSVE